MHIHRGSFFISEKGIIKLYIAIDKNMRSIYNYTHGDNTRKPIKIFSNGVGAPRILDRLSHTYTQIQCRKAKDLNSRNAIGIYYTLSSINFKRFRNVNPMESYNNFRKIYIKSYCFER